MLTGLCDFSGCCGCGYIFVFKLSTDWDNLCPFRFNYPVEGDDKNGKEIADDM